VQDPLWPLCDAARKVLAAGFRLQPATSNSDPPRHTHVRGFLNTAFGVRRVRALEPALRERGHALVDAMMSAGSADIVREFSFPLPALTIFDLIGFPPTDADTLKDWCGDKLELVHGRPSPEYQIAAAHAMCAFWQYCEDFVERRKSEPADDLTTDLLDGRRTDPHHLTDAEVASVIFQLAVAGHETTTNLVANGVRRLLEQRETWVRLCEDPTVIPRAVDEILRFDSSVVAWRRTPRHDIEIAGVRIPAGATVVLSIAAANRDPRQFPDPDQFDVFRPDAATNVSMGKGIHYCIGSALGRREAGIMLEVLAARLPSLRLAVQQRLSFPTNLSFRGPCRLEVEWDEGRESPERMRSSGEVR
jgi:cytochrome P450